MNLPGIYRDSWKLHSLMKRPASPSRQLYGPSSKKRHLELLPCALGTSLMKRPAAPDTQSDTPPRKKQRLEYSSKPAPPNNTSPFNLLPNEILIEILHYAVGTSAIPLPILTDWDPYLGNSLALPVLVSHVCRRWRHLAIATLWNRFDLFDSCRIVSYPTSAYRLLVMSTHFLDLIPQTTNLSLQLTTPDYCIPSSMLDIAFTHCASRLTSLSWDSEIPAAADQFWNLPSNTLPLLNHIGITHRENPTFPDTNNSHELYYPPYKSNYSLARIAPRLTSFEFAMHQRQRRRRVDPFRFGLNFTQMRQLSFCADIPEKFIYALLSEAPAIQRFAVGRQLECEDDWFRVDNNDSCVENNIYEWRLQQEISAEGTDPSRYNRLEIMAEGLHSILTYEITAPPLTVAELTSLELGYTDRHYQTPIRFFTRVNAPALKTLTLHRNDNDPAYASILGVEFRELHAQTLHFALLGWFTRCNIRLTKLDLCNLSSLSGRQLRELFDAQKGLEELELNKCFGTFWDTLDSDRESLPSLRAFCCRGFRRVRVGAVVNFIEARSWNDAEGGTRLGSVCLATGFRFRTKWAAVLEEEKRLVGAVKRWRGRSVDVLLVTTAGRLGRSGYTGDNDQEFGMLEIPRRV
ncbi:hypothetical protein R3P38DRAFT_3505304 [Favolaschia claudopus]|uniref:F-box domain-containing protein n=1 Tax=Favolaschia claudopus TaxID=2862362 RepID=A0AAV9Z2L5_9AGAR